MLVARGCKDRRMGPYLMIFSLARQEFWRWMVVMAAQQFECI